MPAYRVDIPRYVLNKFPAFARLLSLKHVRFGSVYFANFAAETCYRYLCGRSTRKISPGQATAKQLSNYPRATHAITIHTQRVLANGGRGSITVIAVIKLTNQSTSCEYSLLRYYEYSRDLSARLRSHGILGIHGARSR